MELDDFLDKIKERVVYVHAHNNFGEDEHRALDDGSLDWKAVLDKINLAKVRKIIIECRTPENIKKTKKALEKYLE